LIKIYLYFSIYNNFLLLLILGNINGSQENIEHIEFQNQGKELQILSNEEREIIYHALLQKELYSMADRHYDVSWSSCPRWLRYVSVYLAELDDTTHGQTDRHV